MKKHLLILSALLPCSALFAAVEPDSVPVIRLSEAQVSVGRATKSTPMAFSDIPKEEIAAFNTGRDIPFLLSGAPSVSMTSDAGCGIGYTTLRLRGIDPSRINISANGIALGDAESHEVFWVNLADFASSAQSVQLQRGAGTSINGPGAFGGSVNILTDEPSTKAGGRFDASYGTFNSNKETLTLHSGRLGNHWSLDARLSHVGTDGYVRHSAVELLSFFAQAAYTAERTQLRLLVWGGRERTQHAWNYASREEMSLYGRRYNSCGLYTDDEGKERYYNDQIDFYTQRHAQLLLNHRFRSPWRVNLTLHGTKGDGYYEEYKSRRTLTEYGLTPFFDAEGTLVKKSDLVRRKQMDNYFLAESFNAQWTRGIWDVQMGECLSYYDGDHFGRVIWLKNYLGSLAPKHEYYRNTGRKTDFSAYAKGTAQLLPSLSVYADLQLRYVRYKINGVGDNYDYIHDQMQLFDVDDDFLFFNPKAGVVWQPAPRHRVYASFALAQKEPTRNCYTDGHMNAEGKIDPYPSHERLRDWEAGWRYEASQWTLAAGIYYMQYRNQLVQTGEVNEIGEALAANVPSSYRLGLEVEAAWRPVKCFQWSASGCFSRNRIKRFTEVYYDDDTYEPTYNFIGSTPISFSPAVILKNQFLVRLKGFEGRLQTQYFSRQYMTNSHLHACSLHPYSTSDLHLQYTFSRLRAFRSLRLVFSVYNLFNERYENNGYAGSGAWTDEAGASHRYNYAYYSAQAGINVMASVGIEF